MPLTIPNILTVARIIAIPVFVIAYFLSPDQKNTVAVAVFVLAALTDWLDGFLARKLKEVSPFGAFLDPVADKLIVCTALVLLVSDDNVSDQVLFQSIFTISVIIIIGREVSVVALREWMAEKGPTCQHCNIISFKKQNLFTDARNRIASLWSIYQRISYTSGR